MTDALDSRNHPWRVRELITAIEVGPVDLVIVRDIDRLTAT
jgi:hypothetical protein